MNKIKKTLFKDVCFLRGGSWGSYNADLFRAHFGYMSYPDNWDYVQGFRCVSPESSKASKRFVRIMEEPNGS